LAVGLFVNQRRIKRRRLLVSSVVFFQRAHITNIRFCRMIRASNSTMITS
jgi:hypothetical protein